MDRMVSTPEQYKHNLDMLHSLINSRICSTQTLRLIQIRTRIAQDDIKSMNNYAHKNILSPVYARLINKVYEMNAALNRARAKD
jgi:hypothetical protein